MVSEVKLHCWSRNVLYRDGITEPLELKKVYSIHLTSDWSEPSYSTVKSISFPIIQTTPRRSSQRIGVERPLTMYRQTIGRGIKVNSCVESRTARECRRPCRRPKTIQIFWRTNIKSQPSRCCLAEWRVCQSVDRRDQTTVEHHVPYVPRLWYGERKRKTEVDPSNIKKKMVDFDASIHRSVRLSTSSL